MLGGFYLVRRVTVKGRGRLYVLKIRALVLSYR